jgi:hypothetical protein
MLVGAASIGSLMYLTDDGARSVATYKLEQRDPAHVSCDKRQVTAILLVRRLPGI